MENVAYDDVYIMEMTTMMVMRTMTMAMTVMMAGVMRIMNCR